jgi:hypothetical protein
MRSLRFFGLGWLMWAACSGEESGDDREGDAASDAANAVDAGADADSTGALPDVRADAQMDAGEPDASATEDAAAPEDGSGGAALREALQPGPCEGVEPLPWPESPLPAAAFMGQLRYAPFGVVADAAGLGAALRSDAALLALQERRRTRWEASAACADDAGCWALALGWTPDDVAEGVDLLTTALGDEEERALYDTALALGYPWGTAVPEPAQVVAGLFALEADLQNRALSQALSEVGGDVIEARLQAVLVDGASSGFDLDTARLSADLLVAADYDEAFRYDPLVDGLNTAAAAAAATVDWAQYPYSAILVPGQGPTSPDESISPLSIQRSDLAVARWRAGLAPFVLLSGGHVHPDRTPFSEAIEMRRRLMEVHGVPESAILVDPYARHTTTNLRNAARVLVALPIDMTRPILVTSDLFQTLYISGSIRERSLEELGFVPWQTIVQLGENDSCALLTPESLRLDPQDVLDP